MPRIQVPPHELGLGNSGMSAGHPRRDTAGWAISLARPVRIGEAVHQGVDLSTIEHRWPHPFASEVHYDQR
jgi:hypothetical protein